MLAGAGIADFTPEAGLILQGHFTSRPSQGVLHPLEARAVAFCLGERTVCVITLDVVGVSRETTGRIRERLRNALGLHPQNVMVCASHTHCAPAVIDLLGLAPDRKFLASVEDAAVRCATAAVADLRPARLGVGCASAHFNVNRRPLPGSREQFSVNYAGVVDKRVRVLRVEAGRRNVAVLFHYSCHPTTKSGAEGWISSDFPGVARARIEHEMACPALFLPGCFGNIRPLVLNDGGGFTSATEEQLVAVGNELAGAACRAALGAKTVEGELLDARQTELRLPFAYLSMEQLEAIAGETAPAAVAVKRPWAYRVMGMMRENRMPLEEVSAMQLLRMGPITLLSIPGEPAQEMGYALERLGSNAGLDLWPVGYTNDMVGYLVTEQQRNEGGYEPSAFPFFNRPGPFVLEEQHIAEAASRLIGR